MVVLLATGGYDHTVKLWDASSGMCYRTLQHPDYQVNCLQITPDKHFIAAGSNPKIKLYEVNSKSADPIVTYEGHTGNVTSLGFQRDGRWMFSGSDDGTIKIWDLRAPTCQRDYALGAAVNSVALHPNQGELVSGDQLGGIRLWDLAANKCSAELSPEGGTPVSAVAVAADASLIVAGNYNGNVYAWHPLVSAAPPLPAAPSSAGEGAGGEEEYAPMRRITAHRAYILSLRISPDVRFLASTSSDRTVRLWDLATFSQAALLSGHTKWVWDCVFSADSGYLVTASSDMSARLWEVASGAAVRTYTGHAKAVTAVALNDAAPVAPAGPAAALPVLPGAGAPPSSDRGGSNAA